MNIQINGKKHVRPTLQWMIRMTPV